MTSRPDTPTSATFAPRPGAAPVLQQLLTQAGMEARLMLRNGEQLLLAVVIPVMVLVGAVQGAERVGLDLDGRPVDVLTPGVLALASLSTAFTSLAIATGFERRYGILKRLGTAPLSRMTLLGGKVVALLVVQVLQFLVIGGVGVALGWDGPDGIVGYLGIVLAALCGTAAFASLGMLLAGTLRAEATLAAANLVYLLLLGGGAVVLPAQAYGGLEAWVTWLPSGALGEAMRAAGEGTIGAGHLVVLALWAALGTVLTARTFKWE